MPDQVILIASMATRAILADIARDFEQSTGVRVSLVSMGGVEAARRVRAGEPCDLVVLADDALTRLASDGIVLTESRHVFARSATALAVRSGRPRPPRCDADTISSLVAGARAIGVSTGPSGTAVRDLLRRWGYDLGRPGLLVEAPPGVPVAHLLARGEVDIGFQQLSELQGEAGIDIVGTVPADVLALTAFSVAITRHALAAVHGQAFMVALTSHAAAAIVQRHGMEPPG